MTLVYATGEPRSLEFATAASRNVPAGAKVLAVVEGGRAAEFLDEQTFERMSDEEYYALQRLINEARRDD